MSVKLSVEFTEIGAGKCRIMMKIDRSDFQTAEEMARAVSMAGAMMAVLKEHHENEAIDLQVNGGHPVQLTPDTVLGPAGNQMH
ncbi:hypothetical protein H3433_004071 [Escherichia coli]|nr:hypothetical protein [Escherichia coli]EGI3993621.1 hypothetical protein [Escherichia coli]EGI4003458.1 hypothetical protein [Escherichia coli]EGI4008365.1 hypothetical protein [Escherichia coli]EGI4023226.1 hypothetical protein [Escherichia coli]